MSHSVCRLTGAAGGMQLFRVTNTKVNDAKDQKNNYLEIRTLLVNYLFRNFLLFIGLRNLLFKYLDSSLRAKENAVMQTIAHTGFVMFNYRHVKVIPFEFFSYQLEKICCPSGTSCSTSSTSSRNRS